ncbi:hypothetical protein J4573_16265 [Actinomadura barringtoniae]|uniref:Uncharacterized protein n=1 Tax=Actinomadura barringtoniae TaxID=1427535 RepID=A0A939T6U7_9ACTN|nr:hypothetical protein [Actinomadura barringtoniae]MBO2448657.1 hypothetical protein [Actinomadura barringtoniae]
MTEDVPEVDELQLRRIPIRSLRGRTEEATAAVRQGIYLDELERQAVIVNSNIVAAWRRAIGGCSPTDPEVWAALQAALFAAIVVQRVLRPGRVRRHPHHQSQQESQDFADLRGQRLRAMLGVSADSALLRVGSVRDPFEHVDERLDQLMTPDAVSLSDWYISSGRALVTPGASSDSLREGYGLRVFFPAGGVLYFGDEVLDLYALDIEMLRIRDAINTARPELHRKAPSRNLFGGAQLVDLLPETHVQQRAMDWLSDRERRGHGLGVRLIVSPDDDSETTESASD